MEKLDPINNPIQDNIVEERQEIKELEFQGDMCVPRGHTVYFVEINTWVVKRQFYKEEKTLDISRNEIGTIIKGKITNNPNHIVFTALNDKNAVRKVKLHVKELGANPELVKFVK